MRRAAATAAAALSLAGALPARATPPPTPLGEQIAALQAVDARVLSVGWRLAHGNAAYCRDAAPGIGLLLMDAAGYADPAGVRSAFGLAGDVAVGAVASGSPAERAGLRPREGLLAIAGRPVSAWPARTRGDVTRLAGLHDALEASLAATGRTELTLWDGARVTVAGEGACPTRFEVLSSGDRAAADGKRVVIGRALVDDLPEDDLLAAALAHELAHNVLGHRARLDRQGRGWATVKTTEREADRLSVWLMANAGYDPAAALRFFARWGPKHDYGILSTPDHDRWQSRIKRIAPEIAVLRTAQAARGGAADWSRDFKP